MRTIHIGVGYRWFDGGVRKDLRWKALRDFCRAAGEAGRARAAAAAGRGVSAEDDQTRAPATSNYPFPDIPRVRVARLRASAGTFVWDSVKQHISDCDIIVFDVTPDSAGSVSSNVWIEIGYALALPDKRVFLVHAAQDGYRSLPSDLAGLMVGHVPAAPAKVNDQSLKMSVANEVARLAAVYSNTDDGASSKGLRAATP